MPIHTAQAVGIDCFKSCGERGSTRLVNPVLLAYNVVHVIVHIIVRRILHGAAADGLDSPMHDVPDPYVPPAAKFCERVKRGKFSIARAPLASPARQTGF
jgi:hypothetical protein